MSYKDIYLSSKRTRNKIKIDGFLNDWLLQDSIKFINNYNEITAYSSGKSFMFRKLLRYSEERLI
ncbi:MAG: hypothetical protein ABIA63_13100 [bacterium]